MSTISESTTINSASNHDWPIQILSLDGSQTEITFGNDLSLDVSNQYFEILTNKVTIDGGNHFVRIYGVTDYPGLVKLRSTISRRSNVFVRNINIRKQSSSTLAINGGWIGQEYFGRFSDVIVDNCSSSGDINNNSAGGICGRYCGSNNGNVKISNCYSLGDISGNNAGGICGNNAGDTSGNVTISTSYSSGAISGIGAGGICGKNAGTNAGTVTVSNSYSSGFISGQDASGIFGDNQKNGASDSNTYVANDNWSDASANDKLTGTPEYNNGVLVNSFGSVWTHISENSNTTPWILSIDYAPPVPICFPKGTPVSTDQGEIAIEKLNSNKHTIRGKHIVGITKSRPLQKEIVCIEKDALYENVPSRRTIISKEHNVFYKGKMIRSRELVELCENVYMIPYNREVLYNVVLDTHDKMMINNLVCETLDPNNIMAKIINKNLSSKEVNKIYNKLTKIIIKNDISSFKKLRMSL